MSPALLALLLLGVVAAVASGGSAASGPASSGDRARPSLDPAVRSAKTIYLAPTPASVIEQCRRVQAEARFRMLCPRMLPRALIGWPPRAAPASAWKRLVRKNPRRDPDGVDSGG